MKVALLVMLASALSTSANQTQPSGQPESGVSMPASKETDSERQRRWDKAKDDLREKRMIAANAAIAASRKKIQEMQADEFARARAEEADRMLEKRRMDEIKSETVRREDEENAKTKAMAQAVAAGVKSEYRRHVIKDWLQITGEVVGGLLVFAIAAVGIRSIWMSPPTMRTRSQPDPRPDPRA